MTMKPDIPGLIGDDCHWDSSGQEKILTAKPDIPKLVGQGRSKAMVKIYTIAISTAINLNLTRSPHYLDTSIRGRSIFAPTWSMVMNLKRSSGGPGDTSEATYTQQYYRMMRNSFGTNKEEWDRILKSEQIILACFCRYEPNIFCHRFLLKDILVKCGGRYIGEIQTLDDLEPTGMRVNLTYFKAGGKYYGDAHYETPHSDLGDIWDEVRRMKDMRCLPGLTKGHSDFVILIDVPKHDHNHPRLIT